MSMKLSPGRAKRNTRSPWRLVEVVAAEAEAARQGREVVKVDQRVDLGQRLPRQHPLDQPFDRGAVARPLDPEPLVGRAPRRDPGNCRKLHAAPARPALGFGRRDLGRERRRPAGATESGSATTKATRKSGKRSTRASMDRRRIARS